MDPRDPRNHDHNSPRPRPRPTKGGVRHTPCSKCGADLRYKPGTKTIQCLYCSHTNTILPHTTTVEATHPSAAIAEELNPYAVEGNPEPMLVSAPDTSISAQSEQDFHKALKRSKSGAPRRTMRVLRCRACGSGVTPPKVVVAYTCPYCDSAIVAEPEEADQIAPQAILPFDINDKQAYTLFTMWLDKLWFAPTKIKRNRQPEKLKGVYVPYWTYDMQTTTVYTGQRGERADNDMSLDYDASDLIKVIAGGAMRSGGGGGMGGPGAMEWTDTSGVSKASFDDILVLASASLPTSLTHELAPWNLKYLEPYDDRFVSGFLAERYGVDLEQGFGVAQIMAQDKIDQRIRGHIGGDAQRIRTKDTTYHDITFKHILLPIWVSAYRYNGKVYRFVINGQTGEVQGERPYSPWKIAGAVAAGLALIAAIVITTLLTT